MCLEQRQRRVLSEGLHPQTIESQVPLHYLDVEIGMIPLAERDLRQLWQKCWTRRFVVCWWRSQAVLGIIGPAANYSCWRKSRRKVGAEHQSDRGGYIARGSQPIRGRRRTAAKDATVVQRTGSVYGGASGYDAASAEPRRPDH